MSYFWPQGYPITVYTGIDGHPKRISWDWYQGTHEVWLIGDSWSVDDRWWIERTSRTYYKVVTTTGLALVIFQDVFSKNWYIQWLYD